MGNLKQVCWILERAHLFFVFSFILTLVSVILGAVQPFAWIIAPCLGVVQFVMIMWSWMKKTMPVSIWILSSGFMGIPSLLFFNDFMNTHDSQGWSTVGQAIGLSYTFMFFLVFTLRDMIYCLLETEFKKFKPQV